MLTYHNVRSALGQDIRNSLTKFPAFKHHERRAVISQNFPPLSA